MILGDLGAEVIKIEHPLRGDDTRAWGPPFKTAPPQFKGESAYYLCANRNKQSVAVDMKIAEGRQIILDLARDSDVFVENFVPGKLAEYGLGYADLSKVNPRLIYTSITGYGTTGPYSQRPGYDVIIEAEAGLMHITGEEGGAPVKVGVAVTDLATGIYAHGAIMAAIIARSKSGRGQHLDVNLIQTQASVLANIARMGTRHPSIVPYEVFATSDGSVCIGAGNDKQFASLARVLGRPSLATDPRYSTNAERVRNRAELISLINNILSSKTTAQVLQMLEGSGMPYAPVNDLKQTFEHPQLVARNTVREVEHPFAGTIKLVGPAVSYSGSRVDIRLPPPMLGQHTEQVLRGVLGYSDMQVERAVRSGGAALYDYGL
ncbi:CoA-transferase family III [Linderina pennispora]|uniref:CoA-transferase family III n=1 Tax=Linderina pennispora TaxID=61395 RepID=A0A1Y1WCA6_9FUNG|nr:CoA-transferase family III [Linderina pennispora]ORX70856.1 CoA-transferase family III [Linderina pennispora]